MTKPIPYLFVAFNLSLLLRCAPSLSFRRLISAVSVDFSASPCLDACCGVVEKKKGAGTARRTGGGGGQRGNDFRLVS